MATAASMNQKGINECMRGPKEIHPMSLAILPRITITNPKTAITRKNKEQPNLRKKRFLWIFRPECCGGQGSFSGHHGGLRIGRTGFCLQLPLAIEYLTDL
jgi:hypothetical protein